MVYIMALWTSHGFKNRPIFIRDLSNGEEGIATESEYGSLENSKPPR